MNEYQKLIKKARENRDKLTRKQFKQIRDLYKEAAKDMKVKANKAKKGSLTKRWAEDYRKALKSQIKQINKTLFKQTLENILRSANIATGIQLDFFNLIDKKYKLNMSKSFTNMFSDVPNDAVEELVKGNIYKDGRGLSKRIWFTGNKVNGDIDKIIQKGIAEKKSAVELAKDLETYVNPDAKKDWNWKKVYPGTSKTVDYSAQRLARTSISHAYTLALLRSCERNPFITKVRWHSSFIIGRTCTLCKDRDGREYLLADCPLDHPNGLCYQEPLLDDSLENIGSRLNNWVKGGNDSYLDDWYHKYGGYFSNNNGYINIENNKKSNSKNHDTKGQNNGKIDLKGNYNPKYAQKLIDMYIFFIDNGFDVSEHALNKIMGRIRQGRIENKEQILDTLNRDFNYIEPNGTYVKVYNGISAHFDKDTGKIITITPRNKIPDDWEEIDND
jgi:hypothetical protein